MMLIDLILRLRLMSVICGSIFSKHFLTNTSSSAISAFMVPSFSSRPVDMLLCFSNAHYTAHRSALQPDRAEGPKRRCPGCRTCAARRFQSSRKRRRAGGTVRAEPLPAQGRNAPFVSRLFPSNQRTASVRPGEGSHSRTKPCPKENRCGTTPHARG